MRSIRVNFDGNGAVIDFNSEVNGFWPTLQNAVVSVGQRENSDAIYTDKGNNLQSDAVAGGLVTAETFVYALKALATNTRAFSQENEDDNNEHKLSAFSLELGEWGDYWARVQVNARSSQGEVIETEFVAES